MNQNFHEISVKSSDSDLNLSVSCLIPEKPVCTLQIIHGMNEHKERYYPFAESLAEKNIACIIADTRGHGKSLKTPEDLGYMYENPSEKAVSDIKDINEYIRMNVPNVPHFILAHSMGSLSARMFIMENDDLTDGVILCGCPCYTRFIGYAQKIEDELEKKLGGRYRNENLYKFAESFLNRGFENPPHSWISSDPQTVITFNNDPLCNFIYTLNGYEALLNLMKNVYNPEIWNKYRRKNPNLPVHFISGKNDPCMFSEEKFFEAKRFLEERGFRNTSHKLYLNMRHEVLNEKDKAVVWDDISEKLALWTKI